MPGPVSERVYPPVDKLGLGGVASTSWGGRQSLSALDRAGLTQPIAAERRSHSDLYTYSPGNE